MRGREPNESLYIVVTYLFPLCATVKPCTYLYKKMNVGKPYQDETSKID